MQDNKTGELVRLQRKLIQEALNYARMATTRTYLDTSGVFNTVCFNDQKDYEEQFTRNMQSTARALLLELSTVELPEVG